MLSQRKGQVWIETVLYTLIGLALIGLVLGFVTPRINQSRDNLLVEQSLNSLKTIDEKMNFVISKGNGNRIVIPEFTLKRGQLVIDPANKKIQFTIDGLSSPYSEPGVHVKFGKIDVLSEKGPRTSNITMTLEYSTPIKYNDLAEIKTLESAATPYSISLEGKIDSANTAYVNIVAS